MPLLPAVVWAERSDLILVTIQVTDAKDVTLDLTADKIVFKGTQDGKEYATDIVLKKEIDAEKSTHSVGPRGVELKLQKKEEGPYWEGLTASKMRNVKTDFGRWKDEDEQDAGENLGDFGGGGGMPPGMGGMGGMGGDMGGMGGMGGMDMASMMGGMGGGDMGGMGGKGGGKGAQPEEEEEKKGEKWVWSQKGEEVHVRFPLDPPATNKKDVAVTFKSNSLKVVIRGEATIDGALGGKVEADECTWCFSPSKDELQVMLTKVEGKTEAWRDLLA